MPRSAPKRANAPKKPSSRTAAREADAAPEIRRGKGGETHQTARTRDHALTTNQGVPVSNNQSSLKAGERGPTLLEDFVLREKITHFDHERIPERIVHARGSGAHGTFRAARSFAHLTKAAFLQDPKVKTPVFVRFSTVAGGAGSVDTPRDVRGFAVKFYTQEGNFDLVGNDVPVFFIQDAMKFPDLVHSVKMEPDRGFPQAASAHDTFWDFVSLMPEATHMIMWAMSDRGIPRSLRMIEGFGVHTFRLVNAEGKSTFVKFHWRPKLGTQSTTWDEAVKIAGADPDFHRRDLWEAIEAGDYPQWDLAVQAFDEKQASTFGFDVLDPTKLVPEELVPLEVLGTMTLDRNPDNFFAEVEQVAFHPGHVVPGIDFSEDPLLAGRLHSYLDTQLSRLGGPNFHEIPVNRPKCPMHNFQRDGIMRMQVAKGRVNYEPNTLAPDGPRESPEHGFATTPVRVGPEKTRERSASFADHYSQARLFYRSQTEPEQRHLASALAFELGKVETVAIRRRVLGHLAHVDRGLLATVEKALGMQGQAERLEPAKKPKDMPLSPALSILGKAPKTLEGRKVALLVTDGVDDELVQAARQAVEKAKAKLFVVAPTIAGVKAEDGETVKVDGALSGSPSIFFDAVILAPSEAGAAKLLDEAAAIDFVRDAYGHCKVIGHTEAAEPLLEKAGVRGDAGVVELLGPKELKTFVDRAKAGRVWAREPTLRSV